MTVETTPIENRTENNTENNRTTFPIIILALLIRILLQFLFILITWDIHKQVNIFLRPTKLDTYQPHILWLHLSSFYFSNNFYWVWFRFLSQAIIFLASGSWILFSNIYYFSPNKVTINMFILDLHFYSDEIIFSFKQVSLKDLIIFGYIWSYFIVTWIWSLEYLELFLFLFIFTTLNRG